MTTLTPTELSNLRNTDHNTSIRVSIFQPEILLSATVNGAFARGARYINYSIVLGDWTEVNVWHLVYIGTNPGDNDIATMRVKSITSNQLQFDENGIVWQNGYHITIFRFYAPHTIQNRPWYTGGQNWNQYKFYDVTYPNSNQANQFPAPVCIAGPARVGVIDPSGQAYLALELMQHYAYTGDVLAGSSGAFFQFDLSQSYPITPGATITSYSLSIEPTANTDITFDTGTGQGVVQITQPGEYWVTATCTDSNGRVSPPRFVPIRAHDDQDTGYYDFQLNSIRSIYGSGLTFSLEAFGSVTLADFQDGTLVIVWQDNVRPADMLGVGNLVAVGYLRSDTSKDQLSTDGAHEVLFECSSVDTVLDNLAMNDLELRAESNPNSWYQFAAWMYMGAAVHHYLWWHTNILSVADVFDLASNQIKVFTVRWTMGTVRSAINEQSDRRGIFAKLTADEAGRLYLAEDSQMLNTAKRDALDTVWTILEQDISGTVTVVRQPEGRAYRCMLGGTQVDANNAKIPYNSIIPAYIEGVPQRIMEQRGSGSIELVNMVVSDQTDANEKCGRVFAYENRKIKEIRFTLKGNYHGAFSVIPKFGWYVWGLQDAVLKRNLNISGTRWLCRQIELQPLDNGDLVTSVVLEPEVFGDDGIIARFPTTHPDPGTTGGTPDWTTPTAVPAVMTFSSMHYRDRDDPQWEEIKVEDYNHGTIDVWWQQINRSSNPTDVVWWATGDGFILYYQGLDVDASQRTPTNALDEWGDGITGVDVNYRQILTDEFDQQRKYVIGRYLAPSLDYHGWLFYSDTEGQSWNVIDAYGGAQPISIAPLWMALNQNSLFLTIWADDTLRLIHYARSTMTYVTEYALGAATFQQMVDREFIAYPARVKDADINGEPFYVYGRMQSPAGLTGVHHIIKRESGVWSSVENTWDANHCGSLKVSTVNELGVRPIFAYRQGS